MVVIVKKMASESDSFNVHSPREITRPGHLHTNANRRFEKNKAEIEGTNKRTIMLKIAHFNLRYLI